MVLLHFAFLVLFQSRIGLGQQCASRNYGNGAAVCVCNSTYCDTIPRPQPTDSQHFLFYTSNKAGLRFQQTVGTFQPSNTCQVHIDIDSSVIYQNILGFGGAFTDATGININTLSASLQDVLLSSYFSSNGTEYNIGRIPIGGTDFSTRAYSYDDGPADPTLQNFKLQDEDFKYKIPYAKKAIQMTDNQILFFGSAWTAPKWMKTNNDYIGLGFIRKCYLQQWADYHLRFVDEYQKCGVNMWGITTGNEPGNALIPNEKLEVVGWPSWFLGKWILYNLGPTVRNSSHSNLNLMILDDQRAFLPWYVETALRDNTTRNYINGIAFHWYYNDRFPASLLTETQKSFPEKFILSTEACNGFRNGEVAVVLGSWERGENYTIDIIQDMQNWAVGWVDWNLALDPNGGPNYIDNFVDSPIIINATSQEFYKQPMYYHLGHFSKFVPRNSRRIKADIQNVNVDFVAFSRPDQGTAIVLLNRQETEVSLNINDRNRGIAQVTLSARSVSTLLYW